MLEFERRERAALVAAEAREGDDRADIRAPLAQCTHLGSRIEILRLDANGRGHHPPVMGGKNAISPAPSIGASGFTWVWSMAARTTSSFSKA